MPSRDGLPILYGARLRLRPLQADDGEELLALALDEEVVRFLHEGPPPDRPTIDDRVAGSVRQWAARGYGIMAVENASGFIGRLGVYHPADVRDPVLMYAFVKRVWGQGYATEGVGLLLDWLRKNHSQLELRAHLDPANHASAKVLVKFGASRQGRACKGDSMLEVWNVPLLKQPCV